MEFPYVSSKGMFKNKYIYIYIYKKMPSVVDLHGEDLGGWWRAPFVPQLGPIPELMGNVARQRSTQDPAPTAPQSRLAAR